MHFKGRCFRAHTPRWAHAPLSGDGALGGGRFNEPGLPALYLSLHPFTTILEVMQGSDNRLEACTLCEYDVDVDGIVDLRSSEGRSSFGVSESDMGCHWKLFRARRQNAPSWLIGRKCRDEGRPGLLVPSYAPGAQPHRDQNIVLFFRNGLLPPTVTVHDPQGKLPRDAASWGID